MRAMATTVLLMLLLLPAAITHAGTVKTVRVDCTRGQSINAALEDNADELVVEITGLCHEQVTVARDNVTLRGVDPATDGIIGPTGDPDAVALVRVWDGVNVSLEHLQISGSEVRGVSFKNSSYTTPDRTSLLNCWVIDNAGDGGHFVDHSIIIARDTTFARNLRGLTAHRDALVQCYNCTMEDNVEWPLRAYMSSRVYVFGSTVSGEGGVYAFLDASIRGQQTDVTAASDLALWAEQGGEIYWAGGTVTGPLLADTGALITVDGVWHENPAGWINVSGSAALHSMATGLEGNVTVDEFGEITLKGESTLDGDLMAAYGGDAHCEDSDLVTGIANAEHCRNIPCTHPLADCVGVEDLDFDPATQAELDAEELARIEGDNTLNVALWQETSERMIADAAGRDHILLLSADLDAEEAARILGDDALHGEIAAWANPDPPCYELDYRFVDCGNGAVTDTATGLIWLANPNCFEMRNWPEANEAAAALADGQCGLTDGSRPGDWRLPTKEEWETILKPTCSNSPKIAGERAGCYSDESWASGVISFHYYGTSSTSGSAFTGHYAYPWGGYVLNGYKAIDCLVWPVRGGR